MDARILFGLHMAFLVHFHWFFCLVKNGTDMNDLKYLVSCIRLAACCWCTTSSIVETDAAVTIILPALPVCVQWCIKCRAVGRLDLPSHNTLHGLMPPLAGKWVRGGVGGRGGWTVGLLKSNPRSSSVDQRAWQGCCLSVAARRALLGMSSSCRWFLRFTAGSWVMLTQPGSSNPVKDMVSFPEVRHGLVVPPESVHPSTAWSSPPYQYGSVWEIRDIVSTSHLFSHNFTAFVLIPYIFLSKFSTRYMWNNLPICH